MNDIIGLGRAMVISTRGVLAAASVTLFVLGPVTAMAAAPIDSHGDVVWAMVGCLMVLLAVFAFFGLTTLEVYIKARASAGRQPALMAQVRDEHAALTRQVTQMQHRQDTLAERLDQVLEGQAALAERLDRALEGQIALAEQLATVQKAQTELAELAEKVQTLTGKVQTGLAAVQAIQAIVADAYAASEAAEEEQPRVYSVNGHR